MRKKLLISLLTLILFNVIILGSFFYPRNPFYANGFEIEPLNNELSEKYGFNKYDLKVISDNHLENETIKEWKSNDESNNTLNARFYSFSRIGFTICKFEVPFNEFIRNEYGFRTSNNMMQSNYYITYQFNGKYYSISDSGYGFDDTDYLTPTKGTLKKDFAYYRTPYDFNLELSIYGFVNEIEPSNGAISYFVLYEIEGEEDEEVILGNVPIYPSNENTIFKSIEFDLDFKEA